MPSYLYIRFPYSILVLRLDIGIISHACRKWQALLLEEVLDLGSLVVCASVNHIVADKFLLAVASKGTVSHAKQFAQVVVIQQGIAIETLLHLVLSLQHLLNLIEAFHQFVEHR